MIQATFLGIAYIPFDAQILFQSNNLQINGRSSVKSVPYLAKTSAIFINKNPAKVDTWSVKLLKSVDPDNYSGDQIALDPNAHLAGFFYDLVNQIMAISDMVNHRLTAVSS